jgi:hypothetical protein
VRGARRDRVREKFFDDDDLEDEERDWLQIDRILAPHVFTADELSRMGAAAPTLDGGDGVYDEQGRDAQVDLSTSILRLHKLKGIVQPTKRVLADRLRRGEEQRFKTVAQKRAEHKDGDVWEELRERYGAF